MQSAGCQGFPHTQRWRRKPSSSFPVKKQPLDDWAGNSLHKTEKNLLSQIWSLPKSKTKQERFLKFSRRIRSKQKYSMQTTPVAHLFCIPYSHLSLPSLRFTLSSPKKMCALANSQAPWGDQVLHAHRILSFKSYRTRKSKALHRACAVHQTFIKQDTRPLIATTTKKQTLIVRNSNTSANIDIVDGS